MQYWDENSLNECVLEPILVLFCICCGSVNNFILGLNLVFPCVLVCQFMIMTLKHREIILHKP